MKTSSGPDTAAAATADPPVRLAWLAPLLVNAVIWGSSFLFIKVAVEQLHPTWVAAGRLSLGAVTLLLLLALLRDRLPLRPGFWLHMIAPGVVGSAVPFTLFAYGEERVTSIVAGVWNATTALWVLPVAVLVFGTERFTTRKATGLVIGFAGVLMVLGFWHVDGASSLDGQLMCAAAAACYAVSIPYVKRYSLGRGVSGLAVAAGQLVVGAVASLAAAALTAGAPPALSALSWPVLASTAALGVFGSGLALAMHNRVIGLAGASTAAFVTYLVPLVATVLGVLVLGEPLAWNLPAGAVIVLTGVAVAQGVLRLPAWRTARGHAVAATGVVPVATVAAATSAVGGGPVQQCVDG